MIVNVGTCREKIVVSRCGFQSPVIKRPKTDFGLGLEMLKPQRVKTERHLMELVVVPVNNIVEIFDKEKVVLFPTDDLIRVEYISESKEIKSEFLYSLYKIRN